MKKEGKTHTINAGITKDHNLISNWLRAHGDPAIEKLVKRNLAIAHKINSILQEKGMRPADLARVMGKQRSEVTKWLSGTHTFTTKTIANIECALDVDIIFIEPNIQNVYWTDYIGNDEVDVPLNDYEESAIDNSQIPLAQ